MIDNKNIIKLDYDIITNDFIRAGEASSKIKKILKQIGVKSDILRRVAIATYEGEMNIVIHSLGGKIFVEISSDEIKIIMKDNGPGINDIDLAMKEGYSTATSEVRELGFGAGMGLPNIKRCADDFNIISSTTEGTEVTISIYQK